jgi:hypothetical protein
MTLPNEVLSAPFSYPGDKAKAISLWLRPNQPCTFGSMAASKDRIHFCILSDEDLYSSDEEIRDKIQLERLMWKQGCVRNLKPAHGFFLIVASEKVMLAAPDDNLLRLGERLRELWGCTIEKDRHGNDIAWETLFLRNPATGEYVKFTFSLDYFGAQGDKRWWHDHRLPGGIGFTANSVGHMARTREWYDNQGPQSEWATRLAMLTVNASATTDWGKAMWLVDLADGKPQRGNSCPFQNPASLKEPLANKDWSHYRGYLSTDHSLRLEIFRSKPELTREVAKIWLQDLSYIYEPGEPDRIKFMRGEPVSESEVFDQIGSPETWRTIARPLHGIQRTIEQEHRIAALLSEMESKWGRDPISEYAQ